MKRRLWPLFVVLTVTWSLSVAWAQTTGKISGTVVDAATTEAIPGVNVAVVGTSMGASSNVNGEFFILNLPVGTYDLRVTAVGYETQNIRGVEVLADRTYELPIKLSETVLQGQEVTVVAERDVVKRDVSATIRSVTSAEITALPVTTYRDALTRTAGVVGQGQNIHFRGGRNDEVLYLVDGMQVKDPQFQTRSLDVAQGSISEMQVLTAGFDAEYGEAQSAVVNLVIKEGDPVYHGRIEQQSDFQGLEGGTHYQDYDYTEGSLSGPEPVTMKLLPKLGVRIPGTMSFFGSGTAWGRNATSNGVWVNTDRWYRHQVTDLFGMDVRKNFSTTNSNVKLTYTPQPQYKINLGWNQSQNWNDPYSYRLSQRFPYDFTPEQISDGVHALSAIQGLPSNATDYPNLFGQDDDHDGRQDEEALNWADDDGDGLIDEDLQFYAFNANNSVRTDVTRDQQFLLSVNHNVSPRTYYTVRLSMYDAKRILAGGNKDASQYGEASEPFTDLPNALGVYNGRYDMGEPFTDMDGDGMYDYNNPTNQYPNVNGFAIAGDGLSGTTQQLVPHWADYQTQIYTVKGDLTSQVTERHLLKGGLEYDYYNTASASRPYPAISNGGTGIYTDVYRYYPSSAALYLQDKMEYRDIIINAGLRLDYWRIGGNEVRHPKARDPGATNFVDYEPPSENGDLYVSPRLGIAYSVTENDVFHFNYGYFYQRGQQDYYFTAVNQLQTGGTPIIGNPALDPQRTIAYELGVRHQFANDFLLDVATYYKDIQNWINTASQNQLYFELYGRSPVGSNAAIYYNADFASVRGMEFNLTKSYGARFSGRATYTLAWATGKNSYDIGSDVTRQNYIDPKREVPLAWDRRHQLVLNLGYQSPPAGKPFTMEWLTAGWSLNVLSQALSGLPYTPTYENGTDITGQEFSRRSPWNYTTDLNVSRGFKAGRNLTVRALAEVRNVFNARNVLGWDIAPNTLDTYLGGKPGYVNDNASPNYGLSPKSGPNPAAWDAPRLIRAGLALEF